METLITSMQNAKLYPHKVEQLELIETHISWVILTGPYAYKIKKPVNFGFLDFSTLEKRRHYCQEELRLNQRLAQDYYLEVVALTGTPAHPAINGPGPAIEYAVKMKQFPQQAQFDRMLAQGKLALPHIQLLTKTIANFHQRIATADPETPFGLPATIKAAVDENFEKILPAITNKEILQHIRTIQQWCEAEYQQCSPDFHHRKQQGFVRECHGDMHLRNMALVDDEVLIFDCIEFNEEFRWIDIMSEIAFVVMDLDDRNQSVYASELLNGYLELIGDYAGLRLLPYYLVYRALVRAKVGCLRLGQADLSQTIAQEIEDELQHYLNLAWRYTQTHNNFLIITHGLSGSGKTWQTGQLMQGERFIRLRSDVERKRLFNLDAGQDSDSGVDTGIYTPQASDKTYKLLSDLSELLLSHGWSVIVDASFLQQDKRDLFRQLALELEKPFLILDFQASSTCLRNRIRARQSEHDASEATLEVLERQISHQQGLSETERRHTLVINTEKPIEPKLLWQDIKARLDNPK